MYKMRIITLVAACLVALFSCQTPADQSADTILYNGIIFTADSQQYEVQAVAIKDGLILAAGTNENILKLANAATEKMDLKGGIRHARTDRRARTLHRIGQ